jgi:hypothetical protein
MDALFLVAYAVVVAVAYWRVRRLAWLVIAVVASLSVFGVLVNFTIGLGVEWSRVMLQSWLLLALAAVAGASFMSGPPAKGSARRGFLAIGVPVIGLLAFVLLVTWVLPEEPAFFRPVSFLIGHGTAEDNAKWLDFTAQFATGSPIDQGVPMGGPLQLALTFVGTVMGVLSVLLLGGYNEVAVAANTVVLGSFLLAAVTPLALAPLAEGLRRRGPGPSNVPVPWPLIWIGAVVLVAASTAVTVFGHLTFQYALIVATLWSATFLSGRWGPRVLLVSSLTVAAAMTVWLPLNALAVLILLGWLVVFVWRLAKRRPGAVDPVGWGLLLVVAVSLWSSLTSSLAYVAGGVVGAAWGTPLGGAIHGVAALVVPANDGSVFSSPGGTEQLGPLLALLAVLSLVGVAWILAQRDAAAPEPGLARWRAARGLVPVVLMALMALLVTLADFWVTGGGPNYGSLKFMFLAGIVIIGTCLPVALLSLDWPAQVMTVSRWVGVLAIVTLLGVDTLLPRALAAARPDQWYPPIPFENTSGSYWYPAEVNGTGEQAIASNPVACIYLPPGYQVPTAILDSQLSDAQRVYNCTRVLSGLSGMDVEAQGVVDWVRREWLLNTRSWAEMYPILEGLPEEVKAKKVILLDDGSNVVGLETMGSLVARFPKFAGKTPEELASLGVDPNAP